MIPKGYVLYDEGENYLILGLEDFLQMGLETPKSFIHNDKKYKRGMLEIIPNDLASTFCSMRRYDLIDSEIELDSSRHFYLYAKGHYQKNDTLEDLKILLGEYCMAYPEHISTDDVLDHLLRLAHKQFKNEYSFLKFMSDLLPKNHWKFINNDEKDIPLELLMIKKCLSVLRYAQVKDDDINILNLGKADPKILPLIKKENT